jgi:hypothetical protein
VEHHLQSGEVIEKRTKTNLQRYGVECNLHIPENKEKIAKKISEKAKQRCSDPEYRIKMSEAQKNRKRSSCIHCGKEMDISNLKKYHNDNCKKRGS